MKLTRRRFGAGGVAVTIIGGMLALGIASAPSAFADTTQNNACLGVTGTFSTFAVPITGTAAPNPANGSWPGPTYPTVTLSGTSVTIGVDSTLIGAGVATGLVSAADSLADLGVTKNDGTSDQSAGISAVVAAAGSVKLKITGTNTVEGTQTAQNSVAVNVTFYVTADAAGGSVVVYSSVTNPPTVGGPNVPDPSRTGTVLSGALLVPIGLGNTTWTPNGNTPINFAEAQVTPSTTTAASLTAADKAAAPLLIGPKINGSINVPFICWAGQATDATGTAFTPGPSSTIASVVVNAPATQPNCSTPQAPSVGGGQSITVTPSCANVNPPFSLAGSTVTVTTPASHGSAVVQPDHTILYSNDGLGASNDSFQYSVDNGVTAGGQTPPIVTVNISVLNNQCTVPGGIVGGVGNPGPSQLGPLAAAGTNCSLRQVLVLPVAPGSLSMTETALGGPGNPNFSTAVLGGVVTGTDCLPGPITLNGQPQTACGILNPVTVINSRGTDALWNLTGQVSDFIDGTRGPTDTCSPGRNIDQVPPNNHCIPGGNLGWIPTGFIMDSSVPGDTAAVHPGSIILPPSPTSQTAPSLPSLTGPRNNTNSVVAPNAGLHNAPQELCSAPQNQSGGTFQCDAGLLLAVPASTAAAVPGYTATLTLTLS
jgi:hypothetical protein